MKLPAPPKRMLTKDEAASYCGFPTTARFETACRTHVEPVNYGNCVRYDRVRLDEWLDSMTASPASLEQSIIEAAFSAGKGRGHKAIQ
ncbi:MAG TPA: hypothetical protein VGN60_07800 [Devosia sp.]|jgi:hypothetical protein|nr:hypothetical protein [Devosia sp.]